MVRGLQRFGERFRDYTGQYVLIGGAACDLLMEEAGLAFRATRDLDIVLNVEALDPSFVRAFWKFVAEGKYGVQQSATGEKRYYRFMKPENNEYPFMLELFSRKPERLNLAEGAHLTPIPVDEDISSLSAILMNDIYYTFLHSGKKTLKNISIVGPEHLIVLKARAWLDLMERKKAGETIDTKTIIKHKNDVFRMYRILDPGFKINIPPKISADMNSFFKAIQSESVDMKNIGIKNQDLDSVLAELRKFYVP